MPSTLSSTETAFLMVGLIQAVYAVVWAVAAWMVGTARRALGHWAAWAALSAITWLILSARVESPPLIGIIAGVLGVMLLQRGIRLFIGRAVSDGLHAVLLVVVVGATWFGLDPATRYLEAAVNFAVLAWLQFDIARDLYAHARDRLRLRWPAVLALPVALGCLAFGSRSLQALVDPASVLREMTTDSALNLRAALIFVVLVLALHATLLALVVGRLVTELRRLSRHDGLTGLLNRRAMEELLDQQISRSRRSGESFALMMLDLDHFKRINDQHGHAVGDQALKHVSALLHSAMRDADSLARFGGEEFIVLMPGATLALAAPLAERLRGLLSATPLAQSGVQIALSVSIGVAEWRGTGEDPSHLLLRADAALFEAKSQGRNRVVVGRDLRGLRLEPQRGASVDA